jgi:hypothetical protein
MAAAAAAASEAQVKRVRVAQAVVVRAVSELLVAMERQTLAAAVAVLASSVLPFWLPLAERAAPEWSWFATRVLPQAPVELLPLELALRLATRFTLSPPQERAPSTFPVSI